MTAWLHRLIVHLPIGLLLTGVAMRCYARATSRAIPAAQAMMTMGMVGAWVACLTGLVHAWALRRQGGLTEPSMGSITAWHLSCSLAVALLFTVIEWLGRRPDSRAGRRLTSYLEILGLGILLWTAHLGGLLAHG